MGMQHEIDFRARLQHSRVDQVACLIVLTAGRINDIAVIVGLDQRGRRDFVKEHSRTD